MFQAPSKASSPLGGLVSIYGIWVASQRYGLVLNEHFTPHARKGLQGTVAVSRPSDSNVSCEGFGPVDGTYTFGRTTGRVRIDLHDGKLVEQFLN
jgi:hypothetical protein